MLLRLTNDLSLDPMQVESLERDGFSNLHIVMRSGARHELLDRYPDSYGDVVDCDKIAAAIKLHAGHQKI